MHVAPDLIMEAALHSALIGCSCVFEAKWHRYVAESTKGCDEGCFYLIRFLQSDLVIAGICVEKAEQFRTCGGVDNLIDPRQGKGSLGHALLKGV